MANYGSGGRGRGRGMGSNNRNKPRTGRNRRTRTRMSSPTRLRPQMSGNRIMGLPDLPSGHNLKYEVRDGGAENSGRAEIYACPETRLSEHCVKLNDHQKRILSNGDPYRG